jgi:hypothetical protein
MVTGGLPAVSAQTAGSNAVLGVADLPRGSAPPAVALPHFPSRFHAFVWRNWTLVPVERLAAVTGASRSEVVRCGRAMGLAGPPRIGADLRRRSALTVIRRNWHLLPYEQLLALLDWTPAQMAFALREDDFLYVKLGNLKPACPPLRYTPPTAAIRDREAAIGRAVRELLGGEFGPTSEPLFGFVRELSAAPPRRSAGVEAVGGSRFAPRFCYAYFALYGDPLLETDTDPYPEGYLARLAAAGVDGVWLQAVLYKLARFPWDHSRSDRSRERLANLARLVAKASRHGLGVWLYLNEPRAMPRSFFATHPDLEGVVEGDHAALCTGRPEVEAYLRDGVAEIVRAVPGLAGFFTITGSENLTHCWSHGAGANCPRCRARGAAATVAGVNNAIAEGIQLGRAAGPRPESSVAPRLIAWDWGWGDDWVEGVVERLRPEIALMSVSEWALPLRRGGVETAVGEYSISAVGPGPRATRHWGLARRRGLKTMAKIQAGNTWELSAVPYIPAVANVAQHAANLLDSGVEGLMLGWTLGGFPSPNLEVVAEIARDLPAAGVQAAGGDRVTAALFRVATRRFGADRASAVVEAWRRCSAAFGEFPYHGGVVYQAPMQFGPSNLLWGEPTGYAATMVGFPYDDLDAWRAVYPVEVFIAQMEKVATGFTAALDGLETVAHDAGRQGSAPERRALDRERSVIEAAAIHFQSTANQARFVAARRGLAPAGSRAAAEPLCAEIDRVLRHEIELARRLYALQGRDSRLGFEASNQYFYVPADLVEKAINCRDLLDRWLPAQRARWR